MKATVEFRCDVEVTINDPDVITRVTGPEGDEWRSQFYKLFTAEDVIRHLAYNCIANGCENATSLDGWVDLPADAVSMQIDRGSIETEDVLFDDEAVGA